MESIALDASEDQRIRHSAILFAVAAAQSNSPEYAVALLERIAPAVQEDELVDVISWLKGELRQSGFVSFY
jgi:hypothetical protein